MPSGSSGWNTDYSIDAYVGTASTAVRGVETLCRRMQRLGTLLGPEGSVALCVDSLRDDSRRTASAAIFSSGMYAARLSRIPARILRTAQWTRASLWSSY